MKFKKIYRKLRCFDFDDTLAYTDAKIRILNKGLSLSSKEFARYRRDKNDKIDFSDFRKPELIQPKPTAFFRSAFGRIVSGDSDVMILTARPETSAIKMFLSQYAPTNRITIVGGAETPELKKQEIEKVLDDYDDIIFFDDSLANINAVKSLNNPKVRTQLVKN